MQTKIPTLAEELRAEQERFRRRFIHHTRPAGPMSMQQAIDLCNLISGVSDAILATPETLATGIGITMTDAAGNVRRIELEEFYLPPETKKPDGQA